jgi:LmbE family N-acetylglucosaminyl deacetylase
MTHALVTRPYRMHQGRNQEPKAAFRIPAMYLKPKFRPVIALICILFCFAQTVESDTRTLPQDTGAIHLYQLLTKLHTTARIMHTVAHPDDEDGGMMTLESRGKGATVQLFTLNRGEGGQNKFGAESSDDLGILRTLELLQADKYYGVEQRFSHVIDFGYSKTAEETFNKWHGHDIALGDMVLAIRTFRPDVLISRFSGTKRDGHGHHEAAGVVTPEAFRAAADPNRFPEQIKAGLLPWQAKKLYSDNVPRGFSLNPAEEDYTIKLDLGEYSPFLGMSYAQFALEGLAHQTSQGTGGARVSPGHRYDYYKLLDSVLPAKPAAHENDFLDGIDTSLIGLASRLGEEESKAPFLRPALISLQKHVDEAAKLFSIQDPSACAGPLVAGVDETASLLKQVDGSSLSPAAKAGLTASLETKLQQFEQAAAEALGVYFEFYVDVPGPAPAPSYFPRMEQTFTLAVPGQTFTATARIHNRGKIVIARPETQVSALPGWKVSVLKPAPDKIEPGEMATTQFQITVPEDAAYTRPYWSRKNPETETVYTISDSRYLTLPFSPYPVHAGVVFATPQGWSQVNGVPKIRFVDPALGQSERPLAVGPALSVLLESPVVVISTTAPARSRIDVSVRSNVQQAVHGKLQLDVPAGWTVEPQSIPVDLDHDGDVNTYSFRLSPKSLHEGTYEVTARAEYNGKQYSEGFKIISRPDLDSYYAYHPAAQNVQAVDVKLPPALKLGCITGAGDEIPTVLSSVGLNVSLITPQELAGGDLSRYDTIVVGIRAYDVRTDVREQNRRLLDYVNRGGTLIVQYNQSVGIFNEGHYTPYPATLSNARVSVEEMPVEILAPQDPIFSYPNHITAKDFDGWVQERGLYFMGQWDEHFQPLLSSSDPGESPQKGGMLMAHYGKGLYIYSAYAFSRQLPAGVPGAIRLFVNLVSAGHTDHRVIGPPGHRGIGTMQVATSKKSDNSSF